ncbi:MAG: AbrB/MazE/SpoVT family DNA-binding domain-containing protein [bacterium]
MLTKIQKWGNSQGLRFPKEILHRAHISIGDEVDINIYHGEIVVKPITKIRGKYNLKELVSKIPNNYKTEEENWGVPVGKEEW